MEKRAELFFAIPISNIEGYCTRSQIIKTQKSTNEIRALLSTVNMDFDTVVNKALNEYLPKIFLSCPFTEELCINQKQCVGCKSAEKTLENQIEKVKL